MFRVARLTQIADNVIALNIDEHADDEHEETDDELRLHQPILSIIGIGRDIENPATLHQRIEQVERNAHDDDGKRHLAVSSQAERKHERTLEIMKLEEEQESQTHNVASTIRAKPHHQHGYKDRCLHQHPTQLIIHRRTPFLIVEFTIACIHEKKTHENPKNSENQKNRALAQKDSIESALGAENVVIDFYMAPGDSSTYYDAFYDVAIGSDNSIDMAFAAGWGPDYGDPLTYLHCYDVNEGDMLAYSGLNLASKNEEDSDRAVKETIGLYAVQEVINAASAATGDERIELFAKAEAMLEANGIFRSYTTSGGSTVVSKVKPYSAAYGLYGQAAYNAVPYFKYMELLEEPVTTEEYYAAKEAWLSGN